MYYHKDHTHHSLLRLPRRPRVKPATLGLSWIRGGGLGRSNSFMRSLELWRYNVRFQAISSRAARSVMAGWAGSDPVEGRTPEAECQWWADLLGNRQANGGSAGTKSTLLP